MPPKQKHTSSKTSRAPLVTRGKNGRFVKLAGAAVHEAAGVKHTDIVLPRHARQQHQKAVARPISLRSPAANTAPTAPGAQGKQRFAFPVALSQVRDRVFSQAKPLKPVHARKKASAKPVSVYSSDLSPFVLDLKHRRTVVHHSLPSMRSAPRRRAEAKQAQGVLSLFEDQGSQGLPLASRWRAFTGRATRQINLTPRSQPMGMRRRFRRFASVWSWRLASMRQLLAAPFQSLRSRRAQRALQLQWGNAVVGKSSYVSRQTRAGRPIASHQIHPLLRLRQSVAFAARRVTASSASLSALEPAFAQRQPLFAPRAWAAAVAPFAGVCAVIVLGVLSVSGYQQVRDYRRTVLGATDLALRELDKAAATAQSLNFLPAAGQFEQAAQSFKAAAAVVENQASPAAKILTHVPGVKGQVEAGKTLLQLGTNLSAAARAVSEGAAVFADKQHFLASQPLSYKLEYFFVRLQEAQPLLQQSEELLGALPDEALPQSAASQVGALRETLPVANEQMSRILGMQEALMEFLGHGYLQRHLVMFQNNTELRASGGFMGSFALVDMDRGEIKDIEIPGGGPYDLQGSLLKRVPAPRALRLINPRWEFQDSNWFFDWPTSAGKIAYFYEQAGGPSVDGVVAVDTHVMERLLEFVGPVELPAYNMTVTAETFRELLQQQVEVNYDRAENKPKKIIGDLAPILLERVKNVPVSRSLELAAVFGELLQERHIMLYHGNQDVQASFSSLGWGGEIAQTNADYVAVVHTNLAGGKTDGVIKDSFDLSVHIDEKGQATHTLTVKRAHTGVKGSPFTGVRNVDYVRVYVPKGSTLLSATDSNVPPASLFEQPDEAWQADPDLAAGDATYRLDPESNTEIYEETGKTVFAQWMQVDPGQTGEMKLVYRVPAPVKQYALPRRESSWTDWLSNEPVRPEQQVRVYSLYWQKQSGAWDPSVSVTVDYPQSWRVETDTETVKQGNGTWNTVFEQKTDEALQLIFY